MVNIIYETIYSLNYGYGQKVDELQRKMIQVLLKLPVKYNSSNYFLL